MPANFMPGLRRNLALTFVDLPMTWRRIGRRDWVLIGNRTDDRDILQNPLGVRVNSPWSSDIAVFEQYPFLGKMLLRHVLEEWPIDLTTKAKFSERPDVSIIIPFRGRGRLPLLEAVVHSAGTQANAAVECVVVEQSSEQEVFSLPGNPRLLHVKGRDGDLRWNKCLAFNQGARLAKGNVLILHDADIPMPTRYCAEVLRQLNDSQLETCLLQRFLFYLTKESTARFLQDRNGHWYDLERVNQNWVGGTVAITRDAYRRIGGFDTRFTGWTGEDREFFDRTQLLKGCWYGRIPFVHLWHDPAPGRVDEAARECPDEFVESVLSEPRAVRAERLARLYGETP
jgi:hypothetical protein